MRQMAYILPRSGLGLSFFPSSLIPVDLARTQKNTESMKTSCMKENLLILPYILSQHGEQKLGNHI